MATDRAARIRARFRDETAGPPNGTEVAMRCTDHGRFICWTSPPAPPCRVRCPESCADRVGKPGPALHASAGHPDR